MSNYLALLSGEPCADLELFQCHNEKCINDFMVCDNFEDCGDGSDERESLCKVVGVLHFMSKGHFECFGILYLQW